ncbi:hypothetical protein FIV34_11520 [Luteibacter pinisoli]|uniref:Uncharacterized protein n=1 Tax=Luteibacter pinisoli TaxID=2589080 RepID=A0A4Y5Z332_9GAMM|nr:hypothetical protein [Luteibacter pinisoli]QDE39790.1 hypothetical protein FIV34_11520 [Luteibacter pinisoli]
MIFEIAIFLASGFADNAHSGSHAGFCDDSPVVSLETLLSHPDEFLDKRVRLHALMATDGKEYSNLRASEESRVSILTTIDEVSSMYAREHPDTGPSFNLMDDFKAKLKERQGGAYKFDMSKIVQYRQDVDACGRLVGPANDRFFALDDMVILKSYLLPEKSSRKTGSKATKPP